MLLPQVRRAAAGDVAGQQLGRRVLDRQQHAVVAREDATRGRGSGRGRSSAPASTRMSGLLRRQHHAVVQLVGDRLGAVASGR